jgi:hypothetical protein
MVHSNITWGGLWNCTVHPTSKILRKLELYRVQGMNTNHHYHYVLCLVSCFRHLIRVRNITKYEAGHNACIYPYNVDTSEPDKVVNLIDPRVGQC